MPPLKNGRHEKFCVAKLNGVPSAEAARQAGFSSKCTDIYGFRLLKRPDIQARLAELQEKASSEDVAKVLERKIKLTEIIRDDVTSTRIKIMAIAELNKMEGAYAPTKVETQNQTVAIKEIIYHMGEDDGSNPIALPPG
jgi:phage terminase small subunit